MIKRIPVVNFNHRIQIFFLLERKYNTFKFKIGFRRDTYNNIGTGSGSRSTGFCFAKLKQRGEEAGQFNQILEGNHGS